jgi:reverse gyrase
MKRILYSLCPMCDGTGTFRSSADGRPCPACKPLRVVESGLTEGQAEKLVREHQTLTDRCRELETDLAVIRATCEALPAKGSQSTL